MEIKRLENSSVELTLTLNAEDIEKEYNSKLNEYAKKISIKGFRPGKVPASVIQNKFGKEIREEVTYNLMEDCVAKSVKDLDEKDQPISCSTPKLQNEEALTPFKPNTDVTFSVIYDVKPQIQLGEFKGLEIEYEEEKVSDEDVNAKIEQLRQDNAMVIVKDGAIEVGDIVNADFVEIDQDGNEIEATKIDGYTFTVGKMYDFYKVDNEIVGMKRGDCSVIEKTYGDDSGMGSDYLGKTVHVRVKINEVKYNDVPELDDEFAQDVKDEYKTVEDLVNATRKELQDRADSDNKQNKINALLMSLVEKNDFVLPASLVDYQLDMYWRTQMYQMGISDESLEKFEKLLSSAKLSAFEENRPTVEKDLKAGLVLEKISEVLDIQLSDEEIEKAVKDVDEEYTPEDSKYEEMKQDALDNAKYDKMLDFLLENNTFKAVEKKEEAPEGTPETESEPVTE